MAAPMAISRPVGNVDGDINMTPATPPPSLTYTYPRSTLLSLATPPDRPLPASTMRRLSSFAPILRCSVPLSESEWGVSEDNSSLLSAHAQGGKLHPADRRGTARRAGSGSGSGSGSEADSELIFHFSSFSEARPPPVLVDFANPFRSSGNASNGHSQSPGASSGSITTSPLPVDSFSPSQQGEHAPHRSNSANQGAGEGQVHAHGQEQEYTHAQLGLPEPPAGVPIRLGPRRSSTTAPHVAKAAFPSSVNSSTTSLSSLRLGPRESLADLRNHNPNSLALAGRLSRSNSNSSIGSVNSNYSTVSLAVAVSNHANASGSGERLNPFAPPFPLPETTPGLKIDSSADNDGGLGHGHGRAPPSLPAPKPSVNALSPAPACALPSSLPARPGPLPPVFVKRESAALPQPMALRDVAPLGREWEGDAGLSGNEKRRRGSMLSVASLPPGLISDASGGGLSRRGSMASDGRASPTPSLGAGAGAGGNRPERLLKLGQGLRSHSPGPRSLPASRRGSHSSLRSEL